MKYKQPFKFILCSELAQGDKEDIKLSLTIFNQWSGRFLGIIGWDPSVCKANRLHVDILQCSFVDWEDIL